MFERFTDKSRRAVVLAQIEASVLGHGYIGTEHLLLGLVREPEGVAGASLASFGVTLDTARQRVLHTVGEGWSTRAGQIPFTTEARGMLVGAVAVASRRGDQYVGTAHLLLSLLSKPNDVAARILAEMGVELSVLEQHVVVARNAHRERLLMGGPTPRRAGRMLTPAATDVRQRVLALTAAEPVRSYHYLLALFDDSSSVAAKVLASFDIDRVTVEQRITEIGTAGTTDELPED